MADYPTQDGSGNTIIAAPGSPVARSGYPTFDKEGKVVVATWDAKSPVQYPELLRQRWLPDFAIVNKEGGGYQSTFNYDSLRPTDGIHHFSKTGNDTTGDGSEANPYRTLQKGLSVGTKVYMIHEGFWDKDDVFTSPNVNPSTDMVFVAADGPGTVTLSRAYSASSLTWVEQESPNTGVYAATIGGVEMPIDLTNVQVGKTLADGITGVPKAPTLVTSIANVKATPNSYYYSGGVLYYQTHDTRVPDANVKVLSNEGFLWFTSGTDLIVGYDGCNMFGRRFGRTEHSSENNNTFYMYNVSSHFAVEASMAAVRIQGTKNVYVKNSKFSDFTSADLVSLSMGQATIAQVAAPNALIEDVEAWNCGNNGGANNYNCYTGHQGANAILINTKGANAFGPLYAFVEGAYVMVLSAEADTSLATVSNAQKSDFQLGGPNGFTGELTHGWFKDYTAKGANTYGRSNASGAAKFYDMGGYVNLTSGSPKDDYTGTVITHY